VAGAAGSNLMPNWTVEGTFYARRGFWQRFSKHCEAASGEIAREWALSEIGGCHGVKRHQIRIETVAESTSS
jgi:ribosomal protein L20A (L18A)